MGADADADLVAISACTRPDIMVLTPDMTPLRRMRIERAEVTPTAAQLARFEAHVRATLAKAPLRPGQAEPIVQQALRSNTVRKDIRGIAVDAAAGLIDVWSQVPDEFGADSARLDLMTLEGMYVATLPLPAPLVTFDAARARVVAMSVDSVTGNTRLMSLRVRLPSYLDTVKGPAALRMKDGAGPLSPAPDAP